MARESKASPRLPLEPRDLFRERPMANYPDRYRQVISLAREMPGKNG